MAKDEAVDPWDQAYIVETKVGDEWVEELHYGLDHLRQLLGDKLGESESPKTFYEDIMTPAVQRIIARKIRVATDADLENFKDVAEIKKKTSEWFNWANDLEKRKNHLATEITYYIQQNVKSEDDLKAFLAQTGMNTAQLKAIARRGAQTKEKFPDEYSISLDDNFLEFYSAYVASRATKKTTAEEVEAAFYKDVV